MTIRFGPAGLGPIKTATETLENYSKMGLKACEIAFTYSIYIKKDEDATVIKKAAEKYGITLSIHGPYWINLNSDDKNKIEESKKRILDCCEIGEKLGAYRVVFHPGYYGKLSKEETYSNIKDAIIDIEKTIKKKGWKIKIAPEIMGKVNVFGSIKEINDLVKDTGCSFCIDFAHILARYKSVDYELIKKLFPEKNWHVHFSGIEYNEKGERKHLKTPKNLWKELLKELPKDKDIIIINESPEMVEDSKEGLKIYES